MAKEKNIGVCKLCGKTSILTYEHIPPRKANNMGSFVSVPGDAWINDPFLDKAKGKTYQGGVGYNALCKECNSFTGRMYGNAYIDFANQAFYRNYLSNIQYLDGDPYVIHPLKVLKQIISNLICISSVEYHDLYPELIEFVMDKESVALPDKYQVFIYYTLNNKQYRYLADTFQVADNGYWYKINEIAYPPFGFVLSIDDPGVKIHNDLFNITAFKNYPYYRKDLRLALPIKSLEVAIPAIPGDYRKRSDIEAAMEKAKYDEFS